MARASRERFQSPWEPEPIAPSNGNRAEQSGVRHERRLGRRQGTGYCSSSTEYGSTCFTISSEKGILSSSCSKALWWRDNRRNQLLKKRASCRASWISWQPTTIPSSANLPGIHPSPEIPAFSFPGFNMLLSSIPQTEFKGTEAPVEARSWVELC